MPLAQRWARWLLAAAGAAVGVYAARRLIDVAADLLGLRPAGMGAAGVMALGAVVVAAVGFLLAPWLLRSAVRTTRWLESLLFRLPGADILSGAAGAILGLIAAFLLGPALSRIPAVGDLLPAAASIFLGYLGWRVFVRKREDLQRLIFGPRAGRPLGRRRLLLRAREAAAPGPAEAVAAPPPAPAVQPKVLDTSSIIDGRIADLCRTGFIDGPLVVPQFVLDELRHIADSSDALKRNRGRRGLDVLAAIQKDERVPVVIDDRPVEPGVEVDSMILRLARELGAKVITTDYNLNKVAGLQGVEVLNVNELANALKPVYLPGEEFAVRVVREGKEAGQGVGYLDDGTMIVVEGGRRFVGEEVAVEVTSVLQTAAGRMIFTRVRGGQALQRVAGRS
jgi:uncharacterized protein YacL